MGRCGRLSIETKHIVILGTEVKAKGFDKGVPQNVVQFDSALVPRKRKAGEICPACFFEILTDGETCLFLEAQARGGLYWDG